MVALAEMREIWTPRMLSVFRIVVALLYLQHPLAKFFAFPQHVAAFDNLQPFSLIVGGRASSNLSVACCFWSACSPGQPPSSCRVKWRWPILRCTPHAASFPWSPVARRKCSIVLPFSIWRLPAPVHGVSTDSWRHTVATV